jgi:hypothetical protein
MWNIAHIFKTTDSFSIKINRPWVLTVTDILRKYTIGAFLQSYHEWKKKDNINNKTSDLIGTEINKLAVLIEANIQ